MKLKLALILGAATGLAGCMSVDDTASRNALSAPKTFSAASLRSAPAAKAEAARRPATRPDYLMTGFTVDVPANLSVSEANVFFPNADIVWHGEPAGDRHQQVFTIVSDAARKALSGTAGQVPAVADVKIVRFHAVTDKTRNTTGGWHAIEFELSVRHAETGALLDGPRLIKTSITAFGGQRAKQAERAGLTQKVRISAHLVNVLRDEILGLGPLPIEVPEAPKLAGASAFQRL